LYRLSPMLFGKQKSTFNLGASCLAVLVYQPGLPELNTLGLYSFIFSVISCTEWLFVILLLVFSFGKF
jgi:hypothetical protein